MITETVTNRWPTDIYPIAFGKDDARVESITAVEFNAALMERSLCKAEIEDLMRRFIEANLEHTDSGTLYIYLKQLEYAVKAGIENLKEQAFENLGYQLSGATSGKLMGHDVSICYPQEWHYSQAVEGLKERQKIELGRLQDDEKASGIAKQSPGKARLTVTLRER